MISLERVQGMSPEVAAFLHSAGIASVEDLARADATSLQRHMETIAIKRGRASQVPTMVTVRLWIQSAQEVLAAQKANRPSLDAIPEVIDMADIPEAVFDHEDGARDFPVAPERASSLLQVEDRFVPRTERAAESIGGRLKPDAGAEAAELEEQWKPLEKHKFRNFADYVNGAHGIKPLERGNNRYTDTSEKPKFRSDGSLSRRTQRGVLYPHPIMAICGACVSLLWRLSFYGSILGLPLYFVTRGKEEPKNAELVLTWVGLLIILFFFQVWASTRIRCRVCSCHLFHANRAFKNSKAHQMFGGCHVVSLALHLLLFRWFRCMYCGTAIRLFGTAAPKKQRPSLVAQGSRRPKHAQDDF